MTWFLFEYWSAIIFITLLFVGLGFALGVLYQNSRAAEKVQEAREECSRQISRAFAEGIEKAKHDARGRFTS